MNLACRVEPGSGFHAWLDLTVGVNDVDLTKKAAAEGIFLAPSRFFFVQPAEAPAAEYHQN